MSRWNNRVSKAEFVLIIVYAGLIGLAVYLNPQGMEDLPNFIVNSAFFVIVAVTFCYVMISFLRTDHMVKELKNTAVTIQEEYERKQSSYLWDSYKNANSIFNHKHLNELFREYRDESNRLTKDAKSSYQCDIEDYINRSVIDQSLRKNILSLVPGTMTGLGILGTFIGLSFGLNAFSTGTTEEITNSISPLMSGIKVAFHTSIYGMILSLVFNFIYKYKVSEAYTALDRFLDAFAKYVVPDARNENMNEFLTYQKQQTESTLTMVDQLGEVIAQKMKEVMQPQFDQMEELKTSLETFVSGTTDKQIEGIQLLVDNFLSSMNASMEGGFHRLSDTIHETCELQKRNNQSIQEAVKKTTDTFNDIDKINEVSRKMITDLSDYIHTIEGLQSIINDNFMSVHLQMEENQKIYEKQQTYLEKLVDYETNLTNLSQSIECFLGKQMQTMDSFDAVMDQRNSEFVQKMSQVVQVCCEALKQMVQKELTDWISKTENVLQTVTTKAETANSNVLDSTKIQLAQLVKTVQGAADEMNLAKAELSDATTQAVTKTELNVNHSLEQAAQSYTNMEQSINQLKTQVDKLVRAMKSGSRKGNLNRDEE